MTAPFPLVVGCPRSGTTLVRSFLDSHPAMAIPGESDVTVRLLRDGRGPDRRIGVTAARAVLLGSVRTAAWGVDLGAALDAVLDRSEDAPAGRHDVPAADVVREIHSAYARTAGRTRSGDKTPFHANHLPLLTAALPESVVVHVVRDPRSVAAALRAVSWATDDAHAAGRAWRRHVANARGAGAVLGPRRYLEIRYEDLVVDPVPVLRRLCALLGLEYTEVMVDRSDSAARARALSEHGDDHANLDRPLGATREWRRELGPVDVRRVEAVVGDLMISCGYTPVNDPFSPSMAALRAIDTTTFSLRRWAEPRVRRISGARRRSEPDPR